MVRTIASRSCLFLALALAGAASAGCEQSKLSRVRVPPTTTRLMTAYQNLRSRGLRVAIPQRFSYKSFREPQVSAQIPDAGTLVPRGSTVSLRVGPGSLGLLGLRLGGRASRVPNFVGGPLSDATSWADRKRLLWQVNLHALPASAAATLFDAYRVTTQTPSPGSSLSQIVRSAAGIRPTPLLLTAEPR